MPDNKQGKKLPKRVSNPRKQSTRQACWLRGQKRKEANRKRNEKLHKAKEFRRANDTLTETDLMWQDVKDKFESRRWEWQLERMNSDWAKAVGRVKGRRITLRKAEVEKAVEKATKPRTKRPKKEKTSV